MREEKRVQLGIEEVAKRPDKNQWRTKFSDNSYSNTFIPQVGEKLTKNIGNICDLGLVKNGDYWNIEIFYGIIGAIKKEEENEPNYPKNNKANDTRDAVETKILTLATEITIEETKALFTKITTFDKACIVVGDNPDRISKYCKILNEEYTKLNQRGTK